MSISDIVQVIPAQISESKSSAAYEPPRAGLALFRMSAYIELGLQETTWKNQIKEQHKALVEFELVHPDHCIKDKDGLVVGNYKMQVRLTVSNFSGSKYFKLFNKLNYDGEVAVQPNQIPPLYQFLGKPFMGQIHHRKVEDKTYVNLDKDGDYTIGAPRIEAQDPITGLPNGKYKEVDVPEMSTPLKLFLWEPQGVNDETYLEMWNSIYIDGERDDGSSKNWTQELIMSTENLEFESSHLAELLGMSASISDAPVGDDVLDELGVK